MPKATPPMAVPNGLEDSRSSECTMTMPRRLTMAFNLESANEAEGERDAIRVGEEEAAEAEGLEDDEEETEEPEEGGMAEDGEGEEEEDGERAMRK